ncbi:hypothetical protein H1Q59_02560 [Holosporaceae bacterium 'Namur']|nr:hypothetical protein [Holosporaceae bacterium 'Namur']
MKGIESSEGAVRKESSNALEKVEEKLKNTIMYINHKIDRAAGMEFEGMIKDIFDFKLYNDKDIEKKVIKPFELAKENYFIIGRLLKAWSFKGEKDMINDFNITEYAIKEYINIFVKFYESNTDQYNEKEHTGFLTTILKKKQIVEGIMRSEIKNVKESSAEAASKIEERLNEAVKFIESENAITNVGDEGNKEKSWKERVKREKNDNTSVLKNTKF